MNVIAPEVAVGDDSLARLERLADLSQQLLDRARALPADQLPPHSLPSEGPPPPRAWKDRDPEAAERLTRARAALTALAEELRLPVENLLSPDLVRRLMWNPPAPRERDAMVAALRAGGAREWQVELTADLLTEAATRAALPVFERDGGGRLKVNPLAAWGGSRIETARRLGISERTLRYRLARAREQGEDFARAGAA